ncbi:Bestrophin, RFP-TM, chloride channel-domain-containing protein [Trametes punicea]|nr:Bestrophin, RFP-TM, chloride channel-domain-containing protein [Trametes punicea]
MPDTSSHVPHPRSSTGHVLLPAFNAHDEPIVLPLVTSRSLVSWTFGRGTVIWRIWPAVLLHTIFAAVVVTLSLRTKVKLGIPSVMLTVLGVVIGFVISYRASSGYDRYWQGRSAWSDLARTTRTFSRLIWIHVPLKMSLSPANAQGEVDEVDVSVARRVMAEKRMALSLLESFAVSVKHHLRGEMGIYYEDLYPLVKPLHNHAHHQRNKGKQPPAGDIATMASSPRDLHPEEPPSSLSANLSHASAPHSSAAESNQKPPPSRHASLHNPVIPPINAYGTFTPPSLQIPPSLSPVRSISSFSDVSSDQGADRRPLLPGTIPTAVAKRGLFGSVSLELVPFASLLRSVARGLGLSKRDGVEDVEGPQWGVVGDVEGEEGGIQRRWDEDDENGNPAADSDAARRRVNAQSTRTSERLGFTHSKHRPRLAGGGENLPLEILRSLSVWVSVLDARGVVPGSVLGGMYGCLAAFEDSLCTLERILTTPLPFVYSVHIRHTVWIYLFFLPFQLVDLFSWYAIPGVCIAAFIYLGLIAAGEEIEQPFGYDENDLDLDFFCRAIIRADIERLKRVACPNVYLGSHHSGMQVRLAHDMAVDVGTHLDAVFGGGRHD